MRVLIAAALVPLAAAVIDSSTIISSSKSKTVDGAYIVTLNKGSHLKRGFSSPHAELYSDLARRGAIWEITKEYNDDELLTGVAVKLGSSADLPKLAQAQGVDSIVPVYIRDPPKPVNHYIPDPNNSTDVKDVFPPHVMTGVDKLHAQGYFGKGITVGIIDSGIDYTHPALGGKFGPGNKVIGGYDFVGDTYTGLTDTPAAAPDNDPLDQCRGHGTHVAGIIGANPNNIFNISGVAYEASINAYRVFGCSGATADDILIDALMRAYHDGNDVITLSLGDVSGWTESVVGVVATNIAKAGRIVTIAAGNDGDQGGWYASGPGTGLDVISVGSVDNTVQNLQNATASNGRQVPYYSALPLPIPAGLPIYATSSDTAATADACQALPVSTPNLANNLVVIRRGGCALTDKLDHAAALGAKYFLIYDNVDQPLEAVALGNYTAALIPQADGKFLVSEGISQKITLSFPNNPWTLPFGGGGLMSYFSTYGPSNDMYFKPAVSAPGGFILSTYPVSKGSYAVESGTSMATPYVAGSAALLLQIRGKNAATAKAARTMFENTASLIPFDKSNSSLIETAMHQGAGLIQVFDAIFNFGSMSPGELLVNDTAHFKGSHTITIKNGGKKVVTYSLSHIAAGTAPTISGIENMPGPLALSPKAASVSIFPSQVMVLPGMSATVIVTIKPPTGLDAKTFPVYSGFIKASGSDGTSLHSTYLGVAASLKDMKVIDNTDTTFGTKLPNLLDKDTNFVNGTSTYTMNGTDAPMVVYRLVAGSPLVRFDLVEANSNITTNQRRSVEVAPPSELKTGHNFHVVSVPHPAISKRSIWSWLLPVKSKTSGTFANVKTLGVLDQEDYVSRNAIAATEAENGFSTLPVTEFANGTAIPDGSYKILMRALKITGDATKEEDYEVWQSSQIVVKRA